MVLKGKTQMRFHANLSKLTNCDKRWLKINMHALRPAERFILSFLNPPFHLSPSFSIAFIQDLIGLSLTPPFPRSSSNAFIADQIGSLALNAQRKQRLPLSETLSTSG